MRYRCLDDIPRGISVFAIFSYGIAVLPPNVPLAKPHRAEQQDWHFAASSKFANAAWFLLFVLGQIQDFVTFCQFCVRNGVHLLPDQSSLMVLEE